MGHKKRKVWLWLAVERARRRIVGWTLGWTLGCRGEAPLRQLWQALPQRVSPPLLVLHRPVESLRQSAAPLAAPALCQGRRPDQYRRSYQLRIGPALRRAGAQVLFLQQIIGHAYRPN